ncbi:cell division protein FtsZ [Thermotoga sp. KOL6]|uniref:cell division protein FtsZ n=1 Tax=Thermotoga sp. KOL6 TaxID=126741 RepID=UPI000C7683E7|nr:cell division protein FtsZ [Thermotoga sp. KOL6]PLV58321.1 cell division protein FtsZ [Thermotoga sp. KOL6]
MGFDLDVEKKKENRNIPQANNLKIKVIGVGGAGNNAINRMIEIGIHGVEFVAVNTDLQVLEASNADVKIQIGENITRGLGAGGRPEIGEEAALESEDKIREVLGDTHMVFITAGLGGGTGTGASPVIAKIAKEMGILTVAIVTTPFYFEGPERLKKAIKGLKKLREHVDTLIKISNNKLMEELPRDVKIKDAFLKADETLHQGVKGISELITKRGYINLDFADIESVMKDAGAAILGIGVGKGEQRAKEAARRAMESKLIEHPVENANSIVFNITAPSNIRMEEVHEAAMIIRQNSSEDADVKFGLIFDDEIPEDEIRVIFIATRFPDEDKILFPEGDIPAIYRYGLEGLL